jgi:hypothetical protein|tara:strand:- start:109 stop:297 length:189 start_codon:yes stop_codon:yes gene_type:complete
MKWAKKLVKKMTIWDVSLLKTCMVVIGIIIGAYISVFVKANIWWFVAVAVVTYLILLKKVVF